MTLGHICGERPFSWTCGNSFIFGKRATESNRQQQQGKQKGEIGGEKIENAANSMPSR